MNALFIAGHDERLPAVNPAVDIASPDLTRSGNVGAGVAASVPAQLSSPYGSLKSRKGQRLWQIHKVDTDSSLRPQTEALIRDQYRAIHGADVSDFFPSLFAISDCAAILGAIGLRSLENQSGLVEQYLDEPIEAALSSVTGNLAPRSRLIEVGNLAASTLDVATRLIAFLCHETRHRHCEYAVFTGINSVRIALKRLGIRCLTLQAADPAKLRSEAARWGRYYENDAHVMVVDVAQAAATIAATFDIKRYP